MFANLSTELGADAAKCQRRNKYAYCTVGYSPRPWTQLSTLNGCYHSKGGNCGMTLVPATLDLWRDPTSTDDCHDDVEEVNEAVDLREGKGKNVEEFWNCREVQHCAGDHYCEASGPDPEHERKACPVWVDWNRTAC